MATPAETAIGKLDGRNPNAAGYPPLDWVGVTQYQEWAFGQDWVNRPEGVDPGDGHSPEFGGRWWSPSDLDHDTVMAEILTKKYHGCTIFQMVAALFAVRIEGHNAPDVRDALGLPNIPLPLDEPSPDLPNQSDPANWQ